VRDPDGIAGAIANGLQRCVLAEHVHGAVGEDQIPPVAIPRDLRFSILRGRR